MFACLATRRLFNPPEALQSRPTTLFHNTRSTTLKPRPLQRRTWSSKTAEPVPPPPPPKKSSPWRKTVKAAKYTGFICVSGATGIFLFGSAIFLHDAFTYTSKHVERVPVNPLALHPENGGPKNLPVVRYLLSDEEDEENRKLANKQRLVIVGSGWGVRVLSRFLCSGPCF